jgi:signal transduction histidine kinase
MEAKIDFDIIYFFTVTSLSVIILILGIVSILILFQKRMLKNLREKQDLEKKHQKDLLKGFIETQEIERKRIAADLHDEIGASLAAAKMLLNTPNLPKETLSECKGILEKTSIRAREISHNIMPPALETLGIFKVLNRFFKNIENENLRINFEYDDSIIISERVQLALFRITQELTNNTLKYASASKILVSIIKNENQNEFYYSDNGIGFEADNSLGMGLKNIESRTQAINSTINFFSIPDSSTGVKITLSLDE